MDDAARGNLAKKGKRIVIRLARMDDNGEIALPRLLELFAEKLQLRLARLGRIMVVEPDFTPGGKGRT